YRVPFNLTQSNPGSVTIVSGNNQSVNQGQAGQALTVQVLDQNGTTPLSGQNLTWSVTPAAAATLTNTSNATGSTGQASNGFTLSSSATGTVQIKAALTSNPNLSATFTITAVLNVTISSVTKVSGDQQTTVAGQPFAQPLVVQVNGNNNQGVASFPVAF